MDYRHVKLEMTFRQLGGGVEQQQAICLEFRDMLRPEIIWGDISVITRFLKP